MKKFVFLTVVMLTMLSTGYSKSINVVSGDTIITAVPADTVLSTAPTLSEAERLIDKYGGKFYDLLEGLAQQLQVPAEHVYGVFTNQYCIQGAAYLTLIVFVMLFCLIMAIVLMKNYSTCLKKYKEQNSYSDYTDTAAGVLRIIGIVVSIIGVLVALILLLTDGPDYVMQMMNPEFYTIKELMSLIK